MFWAGPGRTRIKWYPMANDGSKPEIIWILFCPEGANQKILEVKYLLPIKKKRRKRKFRPDIPRREREGDRSSKNAGLRCRKRCVAVNSEEWWLQVVGLQAIPLPFNLRFQVLYFFWFFQSTLISPHFHALFCDRNPFMLHMRLVAEEM